MQEIGITLKANTKEAIQSVKELEKQIEGLERVQQKGKSEGDFLTQDDLKQFRRLADEAERIYKSFFDRYNRIQRDFENKKKELEKAQQQGAGETSVEQLKRELEQLQAQKTIMQSQVNNMEYLYGKGQQTQSSVGQMKQESAITAWMLSNGGSMLRTLGLAIGATWLQNQFSQGMNQIKVDENFMSQLGQRVGYIGNYDQGRKDAEEVGLRDGNAFTAIESMEVAEGYVSRAGARSVQEMWDFVNEIQTTSRAMGLDASYMSGQMGMLGQMGALDRKSMAGFKEAMIGAIKESGMAGRDREFVDAVTGLSSSISRQQMEYTNQELMNQIAFQTLLSQAGRGWQGEKGANLIASMNETLQSGASPELDLLLGWGSEFQGMEGRYELEMLKARGITDPEVASRIFSRISTMYGGNKKEQALYLSRLFPQIGIEQADAIIRNEELLQSLATGSYSKEQLERIYETGSVEFLERDAGWDSSEAQRRTENDALWENSKKDIGGPLDEIWQSGRELFLSQPSWLQWSELAGGILGGAFLGKRGIGMLGNWLRKGTATTAGGGALKGGSLLRGAGRFLGPIGIISTAEAAEQPIDGFWDWLIGHKEGAPKPNTSLNPFAEQEYYEDSRRGAIFNLWDTITPWDTKYEKELKSKQEAEIKASTSTLKNNTIPDWWDEDTTRVVAQSSSVLNAVTNAEKREHELRQLVYQNQSKAQKDGITTSSSSLWNEKVAQMMINPTGSGETKHRLEVVVSGSIDGLTKENNDIVTQSLVSTIGNNPLFFNRPTFNLGYEFKQGIGGRW